MIIRVGDVFRHKVTGRRYGVVSVEPSDHSAEDAKVELAALSNMSILLAARRLMDAEVWERLSGSG